MINLCIWSSHVLNSDEKASRSDCHASSIRPRPGMASILLIWPGKCAKGKASSLDIAPLTILNSGTLQPRKWQLTGNDCSTAAHAVAAKSPR